MIRDITYYEITTPPTYLKKKLNLVGINGMQIPLQ